MLAGKPSKPDGDIGRSLPEDRCDVGEYAAEIRFPRRSGLLYPGTLTHTYAHPPN